MPLQAVGAFLIVVAGAMAISAAIPTLLLTLGDVGYVLASIGRWWGFRSAGWGR